MAALYAKADRAIQEGVNILILSDRGIDAENAPLPALLAVSGLHHHLIRNGTRTRVGLVLESGEPREVHHFALLIGYGCSAINPYLAFETLDDMIRQGLLKDIDHKTACKNYVKAVVKGVVKVCSKMGISTIQSYRGAQIFEAVGLHHSVIDKYFTWTPSRIEGVGLEVIAQEAITAARPGLSRSAGERARARRRAASTSGARTASSTCSTRTRSTSCSRRCRAGQLRAVPAIRPKRERAGGPAGAPCAACSISSRDRPCRSTRSSRSNRS